MNFTKEMKDHLAGLEYASEDIKFYCDYDDPPKNPVFPVVNVSQIDSTTSHSRAGKDTITDVTIQLHIICDRMVLNGEITPPRTACIILGDEVKDKFRTKYGFEVIGDPAPYPFRPDTVDVWVKTYRLQAKYHANYFWKQ